MNTNFLGALSDTAALETLGSRLAAVRLKRNLTQPRSDERRAFRAGPSCD